MCEKLNYPYESNGKMRETMLTNALDNDGKQFQNLSY